MKTFEVYRLTARRSFRGWTSEPPTAADLVATFTVEAEATFDEIFERAEEEIVRTLADDAAAMYLDEHVDGPDAFSLTESNSEPKGKPAFEISLQATPVESTFREVRS